MAENDATRFGPRLRELREDRGWTQQELAEAAGLSRGAVRDFEQSRSVPSWDSVLKLAEALGVRCDVFQEPPTKKPPAKGRPRKT
jgi:transcriptional regulator with XRE-family HTH domain